MHSSVSSTENRTVADSCLNFLPRAVSGGACQSHTVTVLHPDGEISATLSQRPILTSVSMHFGFECLKKSAGTSRLQATHTVPDCSILACQPICEHYTYRHVRVKNLSPSIWKVQRESSPVASVISINFMTSKKICWDVTNISSVWFFSCLFNLFLVFLMLPLQLGLPTFSAVEEPSSPTHGLPMTDLVHGQTDWLQALAHNLKRPCYYGWRVPKDWETTQSFTQ